MQQGVTDPPEVLERFQAELALVEIIAGQVARTIGKAADYDDLLGAGREGLFDAARKFDPSRGIPFRAYANFRVRGAVMDGVRHQARLPRRAHERLTALEAALSVSEGEVNVAFSGPTKNIAAGDAEQRMSSHLANMATAAALGMASDAHESASSAPSDEVMNPEEQLAQAEVLDLIRRTIDDLAADEAGVIRAFYFEGKSLAELAESLNFSRSWACRLHAQAMARLTKRIKSSV